MRYLLRSDLYAGKTGGVFGIDYNHPNGVGYAVVSSYADDVVRRDWRPYDDEYRTKYPTIFLKITEPRKK